MQVDWPELSQRSLSDLCHCPLIQMLQIELLGQSGRQWPSNG